MKVNLPWQRKVGQGDEAGHAAPAEHEEEATIEDKSAQHRSFIPKKLHYVVIGAVAVGIGAATYVSSVSQQQRQAEEAKQAQTAKAPEDGAKRAELAQQAVNQAKNRQEQAQDKKDSLTPKKVSASEPAHNLQNPSLTPTNSTPTPIQTAGSTGTPGQPTTAQGQPLPPPPPVSSAYNPAPLTQTASIQGGDDAVRQRAGAIIALSGSQDIGQGRKAALNTAAALVNASNARGNVEDIQKEITATLAKNAEDQSQMMPLAANGVVRQQVRGYPLQMSIDQLREQMMNLRSQLPAAAGPAVNPLAAAPDAAASLPMLNSQTTAAVPGRAAAGVAPSITSVNYDGKLVLRQGSIIPTVSQSAINSDLPGDITAIVTENVYDSVDGMTLLIPKGSRLIASYGEDIRLGQSRIMINFSRLLLPNGSYIMLNGMNGVDTLGQSGMDAEVNNHFFRMFGAGLVAAIITWGAEKSGNQNVTVNNPSGSTDLTGPTAKVIKDITDRSLDRYKNIAPTLTVEPGQKLKLFIKQDMLLPPYTIRKTSF